MPLDAGVCLLMRRSCRCRRTCSIARFAHRYLMDMNIALVRHHLAATLRRLVDRRWHFCAAICWWRRRIAVLVHCVRLTGLLLLCVACLGVVGSEVPLDRPSVVGERRQSLADTASRVPVAAYEEEEDECEEEGDDCVADGHAGLGVVSVYTILQAKSCLLTGVHHQFMPVYPS